MRTLKVLKEELVHAQNAYEMTKNNFQSKKNKVLKPYEFKQIFIPPILVAILATVGITSYEVNHGLLLERSEISILLLVLAVLAYLSMMIVVSFFSLAILSVLLKNHFIFKSMSAPFIQKKTHKRIRDIECGDFTNEPELAQLFAEMKEKQLSYEAKKAEHEDALNDLQRRVDSFINSCEDEEVRGYIEQNMEENCEEEDDEE